MLNADDVNKIAHLARLAINPQDVSQYAQELSRILELVEQMKQIDTEGIVPLAHPLDAVQRLREDTVTETDQHAEFQRIAPQIEADLYLVPKVIE